MDTTTFLSRAQPIGFEYLPLSIKQVNGYGSVSVNQSATVALMQRYPEIITSGVAYVETHGNDSTGLVNDITKPYATISVALQSTARTIRLGNGNHQFNGDYRSTQTAGGAMKLIIATNPHLAVIKRIGAKLSTQTWTATNATVWQTQITGTGSWFADSPHRVRRNDLLDEHGYSTRLQYFAPPTNDSVGVQTAVTNLTSAGTGWTWDGLNRVLYCAIGGLSVQTNRSILDAVYRSSSSTDQILMYGSKLAFDGVSFDGTILWALPNGAIKSEVWLNNCRLFCSIGYGVQVDGGCMLVADDLRIQASAIDGINLDSTRGTASTNYGQISNTYITQSGDVQTYGLGQSKNRQAVSSHAGYFAAFGSLFERSWGQEVADTASSLPSSSWYVGCVSRLGDTRQGATAGFSFYGRNAWLDTCATESMTNSLISASGATVKTYNCTFATDTYTPSSP